MSRADIRSLGQFQRSLSSQIQSQVSPGEERIEIYRNTYQWRMVGSLREDFPILNQVLGAEAFSAKVSEFLSREGSRYASLAELGLSFVPFLKSSPVAEIPFLFDLAHYEWCKVLCTLAPLDLEKFPNKPALESEILILSSSAVTLVTHWPVHDLEDDLSAKLTHFPEETRLLLWQNAFGPQVTRLTERESTLIAAIRSRKSLLELSLLGETLQYDANSFENLFRHWIICGILIGWKPGAAF